MNKRKCMTWFLLAVLLFSGVDPPVSALAETDSGADASRTKLELEDRSVDYLGRPKTEHRPGDERNFNVNFSVSPEMTGMKNYSVRLLMDDEYISDFKKYVTLSKPQGAKDVRFVQEDGHWVVYIDFDRVSGGAYFSFPVIFRMTSSAVNDRFAGEIPTGYKQGIRATLIDTDTGATLLSSNELFYTTTHTAPRLFHMPKNREVFLGFTDTDGNLIKGTADSEYVRFTFNYNKNTSSDVVRNFSKFRIEKSLADGAVFDPDAVVDGVRVNEGWKLSEDGKSVYKETDYMSGSINSSSDKEGNALYLRYDGKVNGDAIKSQATAYFYPKNRPPYEEEFQVSTHTYDITFRTKPAGSVLAKDPSGSIKDSLKGKRDGAGWNLGIQNKTDNVSFRNMTLRDELPDDRMQILGLSMISKTDFSPYFKEIRFYVGPERKVVVKSPKEVAYRHPLGHLDAPPDTRAVEIDLQDVHPGDYTYFKLHAGFRDPAAVSYDRKNPTNNKLDNTAHLTGELAVKGAASGTAFRASASAFILLEPFNEKINLSSKGVTSGLKKVGDPVSFPLQVNINIDSEKEIRDMRVVGLLPAGVELVDGEPAMTENRGWLQHYDIIHDFKGTGRTAVVGTVKPISGDVLDNFETVFWVKGRVTNLSEDGYNYLDGYLTTRLLDDARITFMPMAPDTLGINDSSVRNEKIPTHRVSYQYAPVREVTVDKYSKTETQNAWRTQGAQGDVGHTVDYRLEVVNYLDSELTNLTLYDVLPYKGDMDLVEDSAGVRQPRGSKFRTNLTGPVSVPEGFTVYYTTETPMDDPAESVNADYWTKSLPDTGKVTAFKVVMDEGLVLRPKQKVTVIANAKMPPASMLEDGTVKYGNKAYNSFAVTTNKGRTFTESNPTSVELFKRIDIPVKKVWEGDEQESATVYLHDGGPKPVGEAILTKDSDWSHVFKGMPYTDRSGEEIPYSIKEKPMPDYVATITGDAESGFTVTNSNSIDISVTKVWVGESQEKITVNLLADGNVIKTTDITAKDGWKHVFEDLPLRNEKGGAISYTVEEVTMDEYRDEVIGSMEDGFVITNTQKAVVGFDNIRIYTDEAKNGLPVKLDIKAYQGKTDEFAGLTGDESFTLSLTDEDGRKVIEKRLKVKDINRTIELKIPPGALTVNSKKNYRATLSAPDELLLLGVASEIDTDGHTASELAIRADVHDLSKNRSDSRLVFDSDGFEYRDVVKTERSAGADMVRHYEKIRVDVSMPEQQKTGYGVPIEGSLAYRSDIAEEVGHDSIYEKVDAGMTMLYDSILTDPMDVNEHVTLESDRARMPFDRFTDIGGDAHQKYVYRLPPVHIERKTGGIYSDPHAFVDDRLVGAGRKFYIPVWLEASGFYEFMFAADKPTGVHRITFTVTDTLDVHAYMFSHIDSETSDTDEILLKPLGDRDEAKGKLGW